MAILSVLALISSTVLFWIPLLENFHLVRSPNWQSAITGTGRDSFLTISGTGLCHFRYGHSLGPKLKLDSMRVVPFPVLGYANSGTVIVRVPYQNWTLCTWSHFRYWAMPFPVRSLLGSSTRTGLYVCGPIFGTGLCHFRYGHSLGPVPKLDSMCVVTFPVLGYAIPVRSLLGSHTRTGLYVRGPILGTVLSMLAASDIVPTF